MTASKVRTAAKPQFAERLEFVADVLVLGGGPAGAWAALTARRTGAEVILADKGYFGTSGATAPSNTETWCVPPGAAREAAVARQRIKTGGLSDDAHVDRVLDSAWQGLHAMVAWRHPFAIDESGRPYLGNLRGPDYMRFLRRRVVAAGVRVLDHHPALALLGSADGVGGAIGMDRQRGNEWQVRSSAVVLATGGCAFGERFIGATGLTGDGYLMAVEAGAELSGMELSSQYAVAPAGSSMNKGMPFRFARFYDAAGRNLGAPGEDRQEFVAHALKSGPVYACLDKADETVAAWLRQGQPNCFLPFDRSGIDPFRDRFEIVLRCEGTVRGVGGIRLVSDEGETGVRGLFAAGDVASRESLVGAVSGGGGPNSSWAIASGQWAGTGAARFARRERVSRDKRHLDELGVFGLSRSGNRGGRARPDAAALLAEVGAVMLPLDVNFHRTAAKLEAGVARLDRAWSEVASSPRTKAAGSFDLRRREAAAMIAAGRWALASALARTETRGMHRRIDFPGRDPRAPRRLVVRGIGKIEIVAEPTPIAPATTGAAP